MNWITFFPTDKYHRVQQAVYMLLVFLLTFMFGFSLSRTGYERECRKLFQNAEQVYTFMPAMADPEVWEQQMPKLRSMIEATDGVRWDAGLADGISFVDGEGLCISEAFYQHLQLQLQEGTVFTGAQDEVIVVNNRRRHKIGDTVDMTFEQEGESISATFRIVGILKYPVMPGSVIGSSAASMYESMDGNFPYAFYMQNYVARRENVYLIHPGQVWAAPLLQQEIHYLYVDRETEETKKLLSLLTQYGDVECLGNLQSEKVSFWNSENMVLQICLLLAFVWGVIVHGFVDFNRRNREFGIYFMLGMTWRQTIRMMLASNVLAFGIGCGLAELTLFRFRRSGFVTDNLYIGRDQFLLVAAVVGIYIISVLPVYCKMRHMEPIALIRRKE